jgi:hypothetical protein
VDDLKINKTILWIGSGYAVLVSALYLWGYWGRFGLNFLEYIGLGDMVRYAVIPVVLSLASVIFGYAFSEINHGDLLPPGGGAETPIGRFGRRHWRLLLSLDMIAIALVGWFGPEPSRWFVMAFLMLPLATSLTHLEYFITLMPNPKVRAVMLEAPVLLAVMAFAAGRNNAFFLLRDGGPVLVDVAGSGLNLQSNKGHPVSYVGHLANFFIVYESATSHLVILRADKVDSLVLVQNPK